MRRTLLLASKTITGTLLLFLSTMSCSKSQFTGPLDLEIEIARQKKGPCDEVVICHVDKRKLTAAGVSEKQVKQYVRALLEEVGGKIASAVVETVTGTKPSENEQVQAAPNWVGVVFEDGIDVEVVELNAAGRRTVMRSKIFEGWCKGK